MQAILIIAHKNIEQVFQLADILTKRFDVYVHFDKKCIIPDIYIHKFKDMPRLHIYSQYYVHWGAFSIVEVTLLLLREALANKENTYFHLISGMDWPVKNIDEIYDFYENSDSIYLRYINAAQLKKSGEPTLWWQKYYYHYDIINRKSLLGKIYHRLNLLIQTLLGVNKFKKLNIHGDIYEGSQWCDLPRYAVKYSLEHMKQGNPYYEMLRTGFCSDEFFFQTLLCNSPFKSKIVNDNHRYIKWVHKYHDGKRYPAILTESDYETVINPQYHFARKVTLDKSKNLIDLLKINFS